MLDSVVGISRRDSVFFPSNITGVLEVLVNFVTLFVIEANVGGGQELDLAASSTISWSGRLVVILRLSPGSRIRFVLMDTSECCGLASGCVVCVLPSIVLCRQVGVRWLCVVETGNRASLCVLGTVHLLPRSVIWLLTKSCLMLLSLMNVVPPITGQWRCCATIALNLSLCSFL